MTNGNTMHHVLMTKNELQALRQLLDLAVKHGGLATVPTVMVILQRLEAAENMPLPRPLVRQEQESDSHGAHFPIAAE